MRYVLENDRLRVEVDSFGAELKSVIDKNTRQEYMWQADPAFWGRTSPILFPFVGSLKNKCYTYNGETYAMGQHGFARDMEHTLLSKTETEIYFELTNTEETLQKYPFSFVLNLGYKLDGTKLEVIWKVTNSATEEVLHFSIGAHPAFNCPIHGEENKVGYQIYFAGADEIHHYGHTNAGLALDEDVLLPLEDHRAIVTPDFFKGSTYIMNGSQTNEIGIEDPSGIRFVTVTFDMPVVAIWSPPDKEAPFVCIEPWFGRCDGLDFEGTLEERAYNNRLEAGSSFQTSYTIRFGA